MWKKIIILLLLILVAFSDKLILNLKTTTAILEMFPSFSIKPLSLIPSSSVKKDVIKVNGEKIIIDTYFPKISLSKKMPVIILASGVRLYKDDRKEFIYFAQTLSKLGYVVVYPRSEKIDNDQTFFEHPQTFQQAYNFSLNLRNIDKDRISIMGFSTGASISLVAMEDFPNNNLKSFIFISGYYDVFDYLKSIESKSYEVDGKKQTWNLDPNSMWLMENILKNEKANNIYNFLKTGNGSLSTLSNRELKIIENINPSGKTNNLNCKIYIMHDINDKHIPYTQSIKLKENYCKKDNCEFLLTDFIDHVKPKKDININIQKTFAIYNFIYKVFDSF